MKFIVAVSGGVDSVVLLDLMTRQTHQSDHNWKVVVAHFDHGIRGEQSQADARFVEGLAGRYGLRYELGEAALAADASEAEARQARYEFLHKVAAQHDATIVTAHHLDDTVETVVINIQRGTGWRGLAVLGNRSIIRPLRTMTKEMIYTYALKHRLEWVEDATNATDTYLRNRVRRHTMQLPLDSKLRIGELASVQRQLAQVVDQENTHILQDSKNSRYFFTAIAPDIAIELLRSVVRRVDQSGATRPQLERALIAIKTARAGSSHDVTNGIRLRFDIATFIVERQR